MHDPLDAIRRLYGEFGALPADAASPATEAELAAMADLKKALDGLPPRRPDADVIDAVVAAAREAAAPAALAAIRAVYDEPVAELDSASAAEARALEPVKHALDALPPQRPPVALVDAVVRAAAPTDDALAPIRAVYDEDAAPLASPDAEAEAAALGALKTALDALPPRRPAPALVDAVVASAAAPAHRSPVVSTTGRAADRPARSASRRRIAAALGTVFALVLVFGSGLWLLPDAPQTEGTQTEQAAPIPEMDSAADLVAEADPGSAREEVVSDASEAEGPSRAATPPAEDGLLAAAETALARSAAPPSGSGARDAVSAVSAGAPLSVSAQPAAPALQPESFSDEGVADGGFAAARAVVPPAADPADVQRAMERALDDDDDLRVMYLRLREMQAAQAGLGWDDAPVSLGAAPDSTPPAAGWMQVRVQR